MAMQLKVSQKISFVKEREMENLQSMLILCDNWLKNKNAAGSDYLGWVDYPLTYDREEFARIQKAAQTIQKNSEVLIVIGIGGSYLGARAGLEFVKGQNYNNKRDKKTPDVYFVGNNISSSYLTDILEVLGDRDYSINVISKSGKTTEPAIAFRVFRQHIEKKYGLEEARKRIYATTDKANGALKELADREGYETFVVPDNIGGRFSVLTPVGMLPMAVAGINIEKIMEGAADAMAKYSVPDLHQNECMRYVALRNCLYREGKNIEVLVNYEPALTMFGEWFKQLFAESEGKDRKGIFPVSANFTTDLHSIGQFIQDGTRNLFETVLWIKKPHAQIHIEKDADNIDELNYLAGKSMHYINEHAFQGTMLAHVDGGTPNIILELDKADEYHFGMLIYFFEKACGLSGYMLGVNPFDQPGVEAYKKNMFALLGKAGFEERQKSLQERLAALEAKENMAKA